jgi:hypothetical protein
VVGRPAATNGAREWSFNLAITRGKVTGRCWFRRTAGPARVVLGPHVEGGGRTTRCGDDCLTLPKGEETPRWAWPTWAGKANGPTLAAEQNKRKMKDGLPPGFLPK